MKEKIIIAIYSRKSKYSDKGDSCGNQIEIAMEYIKNNYNMNKYDIKTLIFEDEGFSGGNIERPSFQEMIKKLKKNEFNVLICYRLDRISRNIADFSNLINELSKHNIAFISIKEQFDTRTPMGRAMMYIASVFAQLEREVIAERIKDNLLELSKTGTWLGGETPFGFKNQRYEKIGICEKDNDGKIIKKSKKASKLVIDENEIITVKLIFKKFKDLKSLTQLETYLINNNIKTRKKVNYSIVTLRRILTNLVYVKNDKYIKEYLEEKNIQIYSCDNERSKFDGKYGLLTYNKTNSRKNIKINDWIIAVGLHQGIISGKEWIEIQQIIQKNNDRRFRSALYSKKQILASGLVFCDNCGSHMRPRNMSINKDGIIKYRYCCQLKEKSKGQMCSSKNIVGNELDDKISDILKYYKVPNIEIYKYLKALNIDSEDSNKDELQILEKQLNQTNNEIDKIISNISYIDKELMDNINKNLKELKLKSDKIQNKIEKIKLNNKENNEDIPDILKKAIENFDNFDLNTKRELAKIVIAQIKGNGSKISIILNEKLPTENISKISP